MNTALLQSARVRDEALEILARFGVPKTAFATTGIPASSPITGESHNPRPTDESWII